MKSSDSLCAEPDAQLDSASDVKVKILMSDYQKGLIQAEVTQHYKTPRGDERM